MGSKGRSSNKMMYKIQVVMEMTKACKLRSLHSLCLPRRTEKTITYDCVLRGCVLNKKTRSGADMFSNFM